MTHTIPEQNYQTTLVVIELKGGKEVGRVSIKSTTMPTIPSIGDFYDLSDNVANKKVSGIVTKVHHKNAVSGGPVFTGSVEVILE